MLKKIIASVALVLVATLAQAETRVVRTDLGSSVSIAGSTTTSIMTVTMTMPTTKPWSTGISGPWRVRANWFAYATSNAGLGAMCLDGWIDDGAGSGNVFADSSNGAACSNLGNPSTINGSGISRNTYADGASVTFTFYIRETNGLGGTVNTNDGFVKTHVDLAIEPQ